MVKKVDEEKLAIKMREYWAEQAAKPGVPEELKSVARTVEVQVEFAQWLYREIGRGKSGSEIMMAAVNTMTNMALNMLRNYPPEERDQVKNMIVTSFATFMDRAVRASQGTPDSRIQLDHREIPTKDVGDA